MVRYLVPEALVLRSSSTLLLRFPVGAQGFPVGLVVDGGGEEVSQFHFVLLGDLVGTQTQVFASAHHVAHGGAGLAVQRAGGGDNASVEGWGGHGRCFFVRYGKLSNGGKCGCLEFLGFVLLSAVNLGLVAVEAGRGCTNQILILWISTGSETLVVRGQWRGDRQRISSEPK